MYIHYCVNISNMIDILHLKLIIKINHVYEHLNSNYNDIIVNIINIEN